jgi:hypothetical protein
VVPVFYFYTQPKGTTMKTITYLLRNIPTALWDRAKHKAVDEGISLRELIFRAIENYLQ